MGLQYLTGFDPSYLSRSLPPLWPSFALLHSLWLSFISSTFQVSCICKTFIHFSSFCMNVPPFHVFLRLPPSPHSGLHQNSLMLYSSSQFYLKLLPKPVGAMDISVTYFSYKNSIFLKTYLRFFFPSCNKK